MKFINLRWHFRKGACKWWNTKLKAQKDLMKNSNLEVKTVNLQIIFLALLAQHKYDSRLLFSIISNNTNKQNFYFIRQYISFIFLESGPRC